MYKCFAVGTLLILSSIVTFAYGELAPSTLTDGVVSSGHHEEALQIQQMKAQGLYDESLWDHYYGRNGQSRKNEPQTDIGGETIALCTVIASLPYFDVGNTCSFINNYDEACPYSGSIAKDVVYCYTPTDNICIDISLCNSSTDYDTKLYVYEGSYTPGHPFACNDDACPGYISELLGLALTSGTTYYIIVDGYGNECGNYGIDIHEVICPPPPAPRECPVNTLYGQRPHWSVEPGGNALVSDARVGYVYGSRRVYDNFSGVNGPICDIHWWGLSVFIDYGWNACDEDPMTFVISFHQDSLGLPSSPICSYTVIANRYVTTETLYGFPIYYFETELNPCCTLTSGWVSVYATSHITPLDCWFIWMSSPYGNGTCLTKVGTSYQTSNYNMSFCLTGEPDTCEFPYNEVDMGDLPACNYPTLVSNPAHGLSGVAWLGASVTGETTPNILNLDGADDGVVYHNLPWTPCTMQSVTVTVTAGPNFPRFINCGNHLYLNGWKDGNLDGDFCDTLCAVPGAIGTSEWIIQDVPVSPGVMNFVFMDPGVTNMGIYDGVFRWRLTSQPVGPYGFGAVDQAQCPSMLQGTYAFDMVGEVEDYIIEDGQLSVELTSFEAIPGDGQVTLKWNTASETNNDHFILSKRTSGQNVFNVIAEIPGSGTTPHPQDYEYIDNSVINGITYQYQLADADINGVVSIHDIIVSATPESGSLVPSEYALCQNYPNPFNSVTSFRFNIKESGLVTLTIYDLLGREVAKLVNGEVESGQHTVSWDAGGLASGIYLYKLKAGDFTATKKLVILK